MPGAAVDSGHGITITFGSSFMARITNLKWGGVLREMIKTAHFGTAAPGAGKVGNITKIPSDLVDPGMVTGTIHYNPGTTPPMHDAIETCTITFPTQTGDMTGVTVAGSACMKSYDVDMPMEDAMTAEVVIEFCDKVTITAAT